jgi:N-acetylglutamate synthase-like GNAT family acetyltransferase
MEIYEASKDGYTVTTDKRRLDRDAVFRYISGESYWSKGMSRSFFERTIEGGLCFSLIAPDGTQCGFARIVSDYAALAWLSDVYVLSQHRGHGIGKFLIATVLAHPRLQEIRRWMLATSDAHDLYATFGFSRVEPDSLMTRIDREIHKREG